MKKFVAIFVCLCLLLVPLPVYAVDSQEVINDSSSTLIEQSPENVITPIIDPDESWRQLALNKIRAKYGEQASTMAQSQGLVNGAVYRIRNMDSDKYLNVHYGVDANGTNVYQWSYDGSTEQKFKLVYNSASDSYKLYAMCSSNGNNRVIDVARNGSPLGSGQNVGIWTPIDDTAQRLQIDFLQNNLYVIRMKANPSMFVAVNGTANGTASGKLPTSPGNVYIDTYDVWRSQEWFFELVSHPTAVAPTGCLEAVTNTEISGWAWRSDSPNLAVDIRVVLTNTSTNEQIPLIGTANLHRNDLQNSGYGNGNHGFIISIEWNLLPSGTYSISAYGVGATGTLHLLSGSPKTYTVSNAVEDEFKGSMTLNSSYTSYLYPGQTHIYTFTPSQSDCYIIYTTGSTDVYGELRYDESTILEEDDTGSEGANFEIEYEMDANHTYYIYVRGFTQTASGNYSVKIVTNTTFDLSERANLVNDFNGLLGENKKTIAHHYTPEQCIDIILAYDEYITYLCNTVDFAIPKSFVQALLMRELWCVNETDDAADLLVLQGLDQDCSTGYGQIHAFVAIGALNYVNSLGMNTGMSNMDPEDPEDIEQMWLNLYNDQFFNIKMVYYEIINCTNKTSQSHRVLWEYTETQIKQILSRYNGTDNNATNYGNEVYEYYLIFESYNQ